jgi:hypothetical protein
VFSLLSTGISPSSTHVVSLHVILLKVSKACADAIAVCAKMIRRLDSGVALTVICQNIHVGAASL